MPFGPRLATLLTCLLCGTALWLSRSVLDQVVTDDRAMRIALLPPGLVWVAYVLVFAMGAFALHRLATHPRRGTHVPRAVLGPLLLPLQALAVLLLPFLPWAADVWPALQVVAGPFRWIIWVLVAGQLGWVLWQDRLVRPGGVRDLSLTQLAILVWVATALASGLAASRLAGSVLFPGGDEPHYMVIAQSLWHDGDLRVGNNYAEGDYLSYFDSELEPHFHTRGADGAIYSIHPVGMPVVIAPIHAAGGYPLVVVFLLLISATTATLMWRATTRWVGAVGAATFGWAALAVSAPFVLNTFTVYPEIPASLAVAAAFILTALGGGTARPRWRWLAVGLATAALPWLSTKYAPMSLALVAVALGRIWMDQRHREAVAPPPAVARLTASTLVLAPYLAALAGWFTFFQVIWGSPWPQAAYAESGRLSLATLPVGFGGLLFDQEFGLLPVAPAFFLAFTGLWTMCRRDHRSRRVALEMMLVVGAMIGTVGAFHHWWGGSSAVGRNLVSILPLLMLPMAVQFADAPQASPRRAAQHLLVWIGGAITIVLVVAQQGLLIAAGRDGSAALLEWLSPRWELWSLAPTFIGDGVVTAWTRSLVWIALALAAGWALARFRAPTAGAASLAALAALGGGLAAGSLVLPLMPHDTPLASADLRARSRLAALDSFDVSMRPLAVLYDPFAPGRAAGLEPLLSLTVLPQLRLDPQPLRVIHNGRLSLPAGRYEIEVAWVDRDPLPVRGPVPLGLQVGRTGPPWTIAEVSPVPGGAWRDTFDLAVDAQFFGLRGSLELERAIDAITVRPLEVVSASLRPRLPAVLGGSRYGEASAYFHDEQIYAEPRGFWTRGGRETTVTLAGRPGEAFLLRLHGGGRANRVTLATRGWTRTMHLEPGIDDDVELPPADARVITLTIATEDGFVPADVLLDSDDRRTLGAWVEIVPRED